MRLYKGRTEEEQRAFNEERRRKNRVAKEQQAQGVTSSPEIDDFVLDIEPEAVTIPKLSWKDRILSKIKDQDAEEAPKTKLGKEHTEKSEKLISSILPHTLAALIALYSQRMFSDPFKPCAPSKEEVSTILLPIFSIISRSVAIEGKASQNAIDMGAIVLASITVGTRMIMTAENISKQGRETHGHEEKESQQDSAGNVTSIRTGASGNRQEAVPRTGWFSGGTDESGGKPGRGQYDDDGVGSDSNVPGTDGRSEAEAVRELFRRDLEGRKQMGLVRRDIPAAN